jgi:hypothetical protein
MFRRSLFRSLSTPGASARSGLAVLVTPLVGLLVVLAGCNKDAPTPSGEPVSEAQPPALANVAPVPSAPLPAARPGGEPGAKPLAATDPVDDAGEASDDSGDEESEDEEEAKPKKKKKRTAKKGGGSRSRGKTVEAGMDAEVDPKPDSKPKTSEPERGAAVLSLKRIQLAEAVKDREPVDPEETFSMANTSKLYAFLELSNAAAEEQKVTVTFVPPIGGATKVTLDVGPQKRWRTWALRKSLSAPGTWRVVVRDSSGHELGSRSFEVTE